MKIASAEKMRTADKITIEELGVPGIVLMENAALAVAAECVRLLAGVKKPRAIIVAGKGNNGGDGLAVARLLTNRGVIVDVLFLGDPLETSGDARINLDIASKMGISISTNWDKDMFSCYDLIVDAIFGTGFSGTPRGSYAEVIAAINLIQKPVISVDIPSGVNSTTGQVEGECVKADVTVTFALPKLGLILYPGADYAGEVVIADISIPKIVIDRIGFNYSYLTKQDAINLLPKRKKRSNKGTYGKLFVFAGSKRMTGAAALTCKSAYKAGAGLVYSCITSSRIKTMQILVPEAVEVPLAEMDGFVYDESYTLIEKRLSEATAMVIGPGLGFNDQVGEFVTMLLKGAKVPVIIDADGVNVLSGNAEILLGMEKTPIVTPHPGEMSRLTGLPVSYILSNMLEVASEFAVKYKTVTVLKDARTIIASPDGRVCINTTGNPAMAKGGSGDVLSGVIGAFLAQGLDSFNAAALGAYVHGRAGDIAAQKIGHYGVLAMDIAENVAFALKEMEQV